MAHVKTAADIDQGLDRWRGTAAGLLCWAAEVPLKYTVKIYETAPDGSELLLHRTMVSALTPLVARKHARFLLAAWRHRGATHAKILNDRAEPIYKITE